jgi:Family of unknown function (DUF6191)
MTQWGLDTLFNPAKRHMDEEKQRLQSTREEVGDSSGGKRIDLESGKVTISRRGRRKAESDAQDDERDETELVDGAAAEPQAAELVDDAQAEQPHDEHDDTDAREPDAS